MRFLKRLVRKFLMVVGLLAIVLAAGAIWGWHTLHQPFQRDPGPLVVEIAPGTSATRILRQLYAAGVISNPVLARAYLIHTLGNPPLLAGEYEFTKPLSLPQVLAKLTRGEVKTYPLTVIEGLTADETAEALALQGFGDREVLRREVRRRELIADLDPQATDLEGYLFPDTYRFARGVTPAEVVATLVVTFRRQHALIAPRLAASAAQRSLRELVILASIVEKEARLDAERPLIASVYSNRLARGIGLYADPTIIYALKLQGVWDGNLRRADLALDSPYNTYRQAGLPPGPICSPGRASLEAALAPAVTSYLYFVSRNDGTHVFAETLDEHNRNVEIWQRQYWRDRWARERATASPPP